MTPLRTHKRIRRITFVVLGAVLFAQFWMLPAAFGQGEPPVVNGLEFGDNLDESRLDEPWVDPISLFSLEDEPLAAAPNFDFQALNASSVFASGVENIAVGEEVDVAEERARHVRALQAVSTAELALATNEQNIAAAETSIVSATNEIATARDSIAAIEREISIAQQQIDALDALDEVEVEIQLRLNASIDQRNFVIVEMALQAFTGEHLAHETLLGDPESTVVLEQRAVLDQVREAQRDEIAGFSEEIEESVERRDLLDAERAPLEAATAGWRSDIDHLDAEIEQLSDERIRLRSAIADFEVRGEELAATIEDSQTFAELSAARYQIAYHQRLSSIVTGTDIPLVALNAYVRASRALELEDPGCGIHWSQLAGIGRIESFHGYFGNSTLDVNGQTTESILGLQLDGRVLSGGTSEALPDATGRTQETSGVTRLALIRDTDDGVLDGDRIYDRAVGPMQFIPSTWRLFGADGNGDGRSDPQNIYDASLAAARYLCASPGSMLTPEGEQRGYFAYNHDLTYSANVTRAGRNYHERLDVFPESSAFSAFALLPPPEPGSTSADDVTVEPVDDGAPPHGDEPADEPPLVDAGPTNEDEPVADVLGSTEEPLPPTVQETPSANE